MLRAIIPISSLLVGSAFLVLANGLFGILLAVRGGMEGFSPLQLGLLGTGWAVGFVAATLIMPRVVRKVGHVRAYGSVGALATVVFLLDLLFVFPFAWILLRAVSGFCFAGATMIVESWLNEKADNQSRGTIFSIYMMVHLFANMSGQLLLASADPRGYVLFVVGAILSSLAILPTALSTRSIPAPLTNVTPDIMGLYHKSPVAAVSALFIGVTNGAFGTLGAVFGLNIGLSVSETALMMAGAMLGGALLQMPIGWISDKVDRRYVLIASALIAAGVGIYLFHNAAASPHTIVPVIMLFGGMLFPMHSVATSHANDFASKDDFVATSSGLLLLFGIGTIFGPIIAAQTMEAFGPQGLFLSTTFVHILIATYALVRIIVRSAPRKRRISPGLFRGSPVPKFQTPETIAFRSDAHESASQSQDSSPDKHPL